ncbi:hypothetical protein NQ315_014683, partial [Exocentrus adspersus]
MYANENGVVDILKEDLRNTVDHVFGNHLKCHISWCINSGKTDDDKTSAFRNSGAHHHVYAALNMLITKSHLLIKNETNNKAECFMNILARFNMGKRLNLVQRNSYEIRSYLSALRYNNGVTWHTYAWRKCFGNEPPTCLSKYIASQNKAAAKSRVQVTTSRKSKHPVSKETVEYGPNLAEVEISDEDLLVEIRRLAERLQVSPDLRKLISEETIGQFNNPKYVEEKLYRLTASNFGEVAKRRPYTSCDVLVKKLLSRCQLKTSAIEYGIRNETVAISKFEELTGQKVLPSGLFIYSENGILGASPD